MRCIAGKRATRISALVLLATCLPTVAWAAPAVTFDVAQTARCYPVTTAECLSRPAGNVVEVVLDISCRLISGEEKELKSITYEIRNADRELTVVGFLPSTTMASEAVDGIMSFEEHRTPAQLNLEYSGIQQAKIQAPLRTPTDTKISMKKLAPRSLVLASGTFDRAHGVYFTLHPNSQESVQRAHQFICYLEVPENFRADLLEVTCRAVAEEGAISMSEGAEVLAGTAKFTVGIYRDGDQDARQRVKDLADRQQDFVNALVAHRRAAAAAASAEASRKSPTDLIKWVVSRGESTGSARGKVAQPAKGGTSTNRAPGAGASRVLLAQQALEAARQAVRELNDQEPTLATMQQVNLSQK